MLLRRLLVFLAALPLAADVRLPSVFSDGLVLQRNRPCPVWGFADPGERLTVTFMDQQIQAAADALGRWQVTLRAMPAGGPFTLEIAGKNTVRVNDVLVGEVWLASGQSNMGWSVRQSFDAEREIAGSANPRIRFFKVENTVAPAPAADVKGAWSAASPETTGAFSAVGYFFARHLHDKLKVPVAILQSAWGGTPAESWVRASALSADAALMPIHAYWAGVIEAYPDAAARHERAVAEWEAKGSQGPRPGAPAGPGHPHTPSALWNGMIAPLVPFAIQGAIWYQGETNATAARAPHYHRLFSTLIADWRRAFGQGDFPFLFVQLANYARPGTNDGWPLLREAQLKTLGLNNTGMAVTIDIGEAQDIHPKNKQDVGLRLAVAARALAYGEKLVYSGPVFRQAAREGAQMRLYFAHTGGGLAARRGLLEGFELAGADGKFYPAAARIDGESVVLVSGEVAAPVQARYGWADDPKATLINFEGLSASPFRTRE
ncbi:MAG TPA: sialate O-acetylesterase [Solibacterales bacterium]|nr:sialate O-acetylesterase [Bryobacterales bacterium]